MISISSIGKLQKITKTFTLFNNLKRAVAPFEIFILESTKIQGVLYLILLHFDILVNLLGLKNSLCFSFLFPK